MATIELHELQDFVARCDPEGALAPGNPMYVALDEGTPVRGGGKSCIDELERTILLSQGKKPTCQLFTGFQGTGKTTELLRLRQRLEDNPHASISALYVDFEELVDPHVPISVTDVLRVLAYALDRAAKEAEHKNPNDPPGYLRRLFDFLARTEVTFKEMGFEAYGAQLMLELKNNPTFRQRAEATIALRFQAFAAEAIDTMSQALARIRKATGTTQVVVLADGLEKLRPYREEDRAAVESSVEMLFVQNSAWLRIPCHVIYTFPLWLRFRAPLGAKYSREPLILPMVKASKRDGSMFLPGIEKLSEIIARRIDVLRVFGASDTLLPILQASGGYPRDLLRMTRELLYTATEFPVTPGNVEEIVARTAETYEQMIRATDIALLAEVAEKHELPHGDDARLAQFGRLLERFLILAYRNGREWYDLHPLVRRTLAARDDRSRNNAGSAS